MPSDDKQPVYQWRYKLGKNGHVHPWMDVDENAGVFIGYGTNRITEVEFRIKPVRELCDARLRSHDAVGFHEHQCLRTLGHPDSERHITALGESTVEWD